MCCSTLYYVVISCIVFSSTYCFSDQTHPKKSNTPKKTGWLPTMDFFLLSPTMDMFLFSKFKVVKSKGKRKLWM